MSALYKVLFASKEKTTASQQRTKRVVPPREYAPTGGPLGTYQCDIVFFEDISRANRGYKSILTAISANSRFVYAVPLKKKSDATEAMGKIIKDARGREPVRILWTDPGSEFTAKKFADLMKKEDIVHNLTEPRNHAPLGRIDRFHLTLRTMLSRWFIQTGKNNYVDKLPEIIQTYNSKITRATGMAPAETAIKDIKHIQSDDVSRALRVASRVDKKHLMSGTTVRYITNRALFEKGSVPKWSVGVHSIESRIGVDLFKVKGIKGVFKDYQLQAVDNVLDEPKTIDRDDRHKIERKLAREGITYEQPAPRVLRPRK